jgi:hypothetical protein
MFGNNVGIGTTAPRSKLDITGDLRFSGVMYDEDDNAVWIPGSTLQWMDTTAPLINLPTGATLCNLEAKASYRYIGNEVVYNFNTNNIITAPATVSTANYSLTLPQPLKTAAYASNSVIGDLLLNVTNATDTLTTTYKAYALVNADNTKATLRYLNGTTDASLAEFPINFTFRLQGTITYASPNIANNQPLPSTALPGKFVPDQDGHVAFNTGQTATARFDVKEDSATFPALKVTQAGTGDIIQVVDGLAPVLVIKDGGNVGLGITNPQHKLHVVGNTRIQGDAVVTGNWEVQGTTTYIDTYTAVTSNVTIENASGNGPALRVTQSGVGANYPIADFYDSDVSTTVPALRIADGGNVGVGTATPLYKLHVENLAYFPKGIISPGIQAQSVLSGGGVVTWTGTSLKWSNRVIAIPVEKVEFGSVGNINIECPLSGTIIYYSSLTGVSTVTCDANGIPMGGWDALWYVVTVGQSAASVQGNFVLTFHQNDTWRPTSNWILIAVYNGDTIYGGHIKWMPGQINFPYAGGVYNSQLGTNNWTTAVSVQASDGTVAAPSIAFSSDLDTGMYRPGDNKLGLVTAGVERVSVLANGNVGIGTTNPQSKFHIINTGNNATYGLLSIENNESFVFNTGLGVTAGLSFRTQWNGNNASPTTTMAQINCVKEQNANYGDSYLSFHTRYTADRGNGGEGVLSEKLRITSTGNVGIGTTAPLSLLSVEKNTSDDSSAVIRLSNRYGSGSLNPVGAGMRLVFTGYRDASSTHEIAAISAMKVNGDRGDYLVNGGELHFSTNPGISPYPERGNVQMVINKFGNVGIGNLSPSHRLHVNGNIVASGVLCTDRQRLCFSSPSDTNHSIYNNYANLDGEGSFDGMKMNVYAGLDIRTGNSLGATPALRMRINSDGNVGIGTNNPLTNLHLYMSGTGGPAIRFQNGSFLWGSGIGYSEFYVYNASAIGVFLPYGSTSWNVNGSDERIKQDITPLSDALSIITKLEPVTFKYKIDTSTTHHGFIAQNIEKVIPSQLIENKAADNIKQYLDGEDKVKTYNSEFLIPYLVKSVHELHEMVMKLTEQINNKP